MTATLKTGIVQEPSSSIANLTLSSSGGVTFGAAATTNTITSAAATALTLQSVGTTAMTIDTSQNVGIGTTSPKARVSVQGSGLTLVNLIPENGASNTYQNGIGFNIGFDGTNWTTVGAGSNGGSYIGTDYGNGAIKFMTVASTGGTAQSISNATFATYERMRIDSSGNLLVGTTSTGLPGVLGTATLNISSKNSNNGITVDAIPTGGFTAFGTRPSGAFNYYAGFFVNSSNTTVGTISCTTTATTYNTSSDYRLKENVVSMTGGIATVSALKPVKYDWISNKEQGEGFIAHELQAVIPLAVHGEKDAVNEDGSIKPQGVDYSKIVVHLVAALQELSAKVDAQAAEITALKAKVGA